VTGFLQKIDHSQSCHSWGGAGKYQTGERDATINFSRQNQTESRSIMKLLVPFLFSVFPAATVALSQSPSPQPPSGMPSPTTTEVMVMMTAKQGVNRQQIMDVMPAEIRATVKLYLEGKIRQWYSKGDGRGVVVFLDVKTVDEAHAIIDTLPLSKENLMDHEYIPVGPLMPLTFLTGGGAARQ